MPPWWCYLHIQNLSCFLILGVHFEVACLYIARLIYTIVILAPGGPGLSYVGIFAVLALRHWISFHVGTWSKLNACVATPSLAHKKPSCVDIHVAVVVNTSGYLLFPWPYWIFACLLWLFLLTELRQGARSFLNIYNMKWVELISMLRSRYLFDSLRKLFSVNSCNYHLGWGDFAYIRGDPMSLLLSNMPGKGSK